MDLFHDSIDRRISISSVLCINFWDLFIEEFQFSKNIEMRNAFPLKTRQLGENRILDPDRENVTQNFSFFYEE